MTPPLNIQAWTRLLAFGLMIGMSATQAAEVKVLAVNAVKDGLC